MSKTKKIRDNVVIARALNSRRDPDINAAWYAGKKIVRVETMDGTTYQLKLVKGRHYFKKDKKK